MIYHPRGGFAPPLSRSLLEFDLVGNVLTKTEHAYTTADTVGTATDTISYAYGYSEWGDRLTKFDGKYFTFDDLGNPLTYGDDVSYTWKNGRQLGTMTMGDETWSFTYDSDGLRLGRTNGTDSYSYLYADGLLTRMVVGSTTMLFYYDGSGRPVAISYGGTMYYYVLDLQGDVMGIRDSSGTLVVRYYYDAWGRLLSTTGSKASTLGVHNPLRYRGYVYDTETGLYYLQSRYYDPEMGRFINADNYPTTGQGFTGNNMFAYCGNNPVSREDDGGTWWNNAIGAVVGGIVSGITTAINGGSGWEILVSAGCGAVSGALSATGCGGVWGQAAIGAVTSFIDSGFQNMVDCISGEKTIEEAVACTLVDTTMGAVFGAMGYEGTDSLENSMKMAKKTKSAKNILSQKGVHPNVKSTAKAVVKQGQDYFWQEVGGCVFDSITTSAVGCGTSEVAGLYFAMLF